MKKRKLKKGTSSKRGSNASDKKECKALAETGQKTVGESGFHGDRKKAKTEAKSETKTIPPIEELETQPDPLAQEDVDPINVEAQLKALQILNLQPDQQWQTCFEAVAGLAHRDASPPLPCQDSATALNNPRPTVIVADGAGSSAVSEIGSQAVTTGLARFLNTIERQVAHLLDTPEGDKDEAIRNFGLLLVKHAKGLLDDLAAQHRRPQKDFRCTLLLVIQGKSRLMWLKVGDGALITETLIKQGDQLQSRLMALGRVGKGEFANATTFIDQNLQLSDVQTGSCDSALITGFAAMSDGGADRLVSNDGQKVSGQISSWLHKLRQGQLKRREITLMFVSDTFTRGTTGDDISIALCSSGLQANGELSDQPAL